MLGYLFTDDFGFFSTRTSTAKIPDIGKVAGGGDFLLYNSPAAAFFAAAAYGTILC